MPKAKVKFFLGAVLELQSSNKAIEHQARAIIAHITQTAAASITYAGVVSCKGPSLMLQTVKTSKGTWKESEIKIKMFSQ